MSAHEEAVAIWRGYYGPTAKARGNAPTMPRMQLAQLRQQAVERELAADQARVAWRHTAAGEPLLMAGEARVALVGYAVVWDALSTEMGPFRERILRGAFARSLAASPDIAACLGHAPERRLGGSAEGNLHLREDEYGLAFELQPLDSPASREAVEGIRSGRLRGMSPRLRFDGEEWQRSGRFGVRTVAAASIAHIAIVERPAYEATTVRLELRSPASTLTA